MAHPLDRLKSPWIMLVFTIGLAAVVAWIAYAYLQQREERIKKEVAERSAKRQTPKVSVIVPREDARVGVVIDTGLFVSREIDKDLAYPDTLNAEDFATVRGQRLARPVLRGRPLRVTDLQVPEIHDVASVLPEGMRAVTIEIDSVNSIAQTLRPGHRVDLFLLSKANKPKDTEIPELALNQATLFMQNLAVLATGQEFQDIASDNSDRIQKMVRPGEVEGAREKGFDTITVLVSPKEAARLLIGQKMGTFRVALRGSKDLTPVAMRSVTGGEVLPMGTGGVRDGVEFIVGGKSSGNATVASMLVPTGLPPGTGGAGVVRQPQPDVQTTVRETLQQLTTPQRRIGDANGNKPEPLTKPR